MKFVPTCTLGKSTLSPLWGWGGTARGKGGLDIRRTHRFPELLLCTHGGGGCHLLYLTLSLPLQLLNRQSQELGASGERARVTRIITRTLSENCISEVTFPDPPIGLEGLKCLFRSHGPTGEVGGQGERTGNWMVKKLICEPGNDQS